MFVGGINYKLRRAWSVMEAHIEAERRVRGKPFLDGFEHLAARAFATDPYLFQRKVRFQKIPVGAERIGVRAASQETELPAGVDRVESPQAANPSA